MSNNATKAVILSSPSGGGKSTIINLLLAARPNFRHSVSATTRDPRPQEVDGREYSFITKEAFQDLITRQALAEWALVHKEWYGTPIGQLAQLQQQGFDILFDLDVVGTATMKKRWSSILTIYLLPPSREELENRLRLRKSETEAHIQYRLQRFDMEQKAAARYDFRIINDKLDDTVAEVTRCIDDWQSLTEF